MTTVKSEEREDDNGCMLASFSKRASLLGAGMWAIPGGNYLDKGKGGAQSGPLGLTDEIP
jgi:hypothetical protein